MMLPILYVALLVGAALLAADLLDRMLLLLGALPSMLLLFLAPIIAMAGIGLARPTPVPPIAQAVSRRR